MSDNEEQPLVWTGELKVGEAASTAKTVHRLQVGVQWPYYVIAVAGFLAAIPGGLIGASLQSGPDEDLLPILGVVLGVIVGVCVSRLIIRRVSMGRFRRRMQAQGFGVNLKQEVSVEPERLSYRLGGVTTTAEWAAITHLAPIGAYWVIIAQMSPMYVPRRYFKDRADEQRFVRAILERSSAPARDRSSKAVAFAA